MQKVGMRMPKAVNDLIVVLITPSVLSRIYWWPFFWCDRMLCVVALSNFSN